MDNMKNGVHADTAEAENTETMDLLAGMLDASTHCGDNDEDDKEPAQAVEETPGEESAPGNNNRREKPTVLFNEQSVRTVRTLTVSSILGRSRTKEDSGE